MVYTVRLLFYLVFGTLKDSVKAMFGMAYRYWIVGKLSAHKVTLRIVQWSGILVTKGKSLSVAHFGLKPKI